MLQYAAMVYSVLHRFNVGRFGGNVRYFKYVLQCVAVCCSMLQWFTVCCIAPMLASLAGMVAI